MSDEKKKIMVVPKVLKKHILDKDIISKFRGAGYNIGLAAERLDMTIEDFYALLTERPKLKERLISLRNEPLAKGLRAAILLLKEPDPRIRANAINLIFSRYKDSDVLSSLFENEAEDIVKNVRGKAVKIEKQRIKDGTTMEDAALEWSKILGRISIKK